MKYLLVGRNYILPFSNCIAYQLLQVYQTIWQSLGKNLEMLGFELQLNPIRPISPTGEKYCLIIVTKAHFTLINTEKTNVKTKYILVVDNNTGSCINENKF
jgi:hypothetical protein